MATPVIMPRQGQSVESCIITKWHKNIGDKVNISDKLFTYETDKASFDEEAQSDGVMLAMFFEEGEEAGCLTNVCVIGEQGEDISSLMPVDTDSSDGYGTAAPAAETASMASEPVNAIDSVRPQNVSGHVKISPRARALAERRRVDLKYTTATGPLGRIIERDVQALVAKRRYIGTPIEQAAVQTTVVPDVSEWEITPISAVRKMIAKAMHGSLANMAQLTLNTSFDASDILAFRNKAKAAAEDFGVAAASVTDMIVYAVSRSLANHKSLNAHFLEDNTMKIFRHTNIGVAVDTPRGLLVPTIFNAGNMSLSEISAETKSLYAMCAQGTISPDSMQGASFTISNLGAMGVESFTPILNPPQTGLLGVCSIIERTKNGEIYPAMGLSLTFDHRALDGADAARFLQDLVKCLENFTVFAALL